MNTYGLWSAALTALIRLRGSPPQDARSWQVFSIEF